MKKKNKNPGFKSNFDVKINLSKNTFPGLKPCCSNIFRSLNVNTKGTPSLTTETDACARANLGFDDFDVNITILRKSISDAKIKES